LARLTYSCPFQCGHQCVQVGGAGGKVIQQWQLYQVVLVFTASNKTACLGDVQLYTCLLIQLIQKFAIRFADYLDQL